VFRGAAEPAVVLPAIIGWRLLKKPVGGPRGAAALLASAGLITLSLKHAR
jgi:hypothetical protein